MSDFLPPHGLETGQASLESTTRLDLVLTPGMALGCACISQVRLTHLPLPALFSKRVLVIHLHVLRDRRWTVVTRGGVQVRSNQPFSSCSPTRHFFPAVSRERDLWILSFFFFPSSLSLSLPSSPSSSILFPQHSYLRMDLQKNNRNHCLSPDGIAQTIPEWTVCNQLV